MFALIGRLGKYRARGNIGARVLETIMAGKRGKLPSYCCASFFFGYRLSHMSCDPVWWQPRVWSRD